MGRRLSRASAAGPLLAALLAAVVVTASCSAPGGTFRAFGAGGADASAVGGGDAAATTSASPVEATWMDLEQQLEGTLVALTGRIRAGVLVSCFSGICDLVLADPADDSRTALVDVLAVDEAGVPNTMVELPDPFTEDDLRLTTADGLEVRTGDLVRIVGTLERGETYVKINLHRLDAVAEPGSAADMTPDTVTFRELAGLPEGTLVRVKGSLSVPTFTFCNDRICSITLEDPKSARTAGLRMPAIRDDDARRNGMLPLPSDFSDRDLRVFTDDGGRVGYGDSVWITGTLANDPADRERDIDVSLVVGVP